MKGRRANVATRRIITNDKENQEPRRTFEYGAAQSCTCPVGFENTVALLSTVASNDYQFNRPQNDRVLPESCEFKVDHVHNIDGIKWERRSAMLILALGKHVASSYPRIVDYCGGILLRR